MAILGRQDVAQLGLSLIVQNVAAAATFYRDVLGAEEVNHNHGGDAQPAAVELRLGGAYLVVTRENPRWREAPCPDWPRSPVSAGAASAFMTLYVDNVDAVFARALAAGASSLDANRAPQATFWGDRAVQFRDPAGHLWRLMTRLEDIEAADLPARLDALGAAQRHPAPS
jgi:PhnB protein